jgi:hypothetical protein
MPGVKERELVFGHLFFLRGYMANYWEVFFFFFSLMPPLFFVRHIEEAFS